MLRAIFLLGLIVLTSTSALQAQDRAPRAGALSARLRAIDASLLGVCGQLDRNSGMTRANAARGRELLGRRREIEAQLLDAGIAPRPLRIPETCSTALASRGPKKGKGGGGYRHNAKTAAPDPAAPASEQIDSLFPWPPPTPSEKGDVSRDVIPGQPPARLWGDVADRLETQLDVGGYRSVSYLAVPNGFALITKVERIDEATRTPLQGTLRWSDQIAASGFSWWNIFSVSRPKGLYRAFVFLLTNDPPATQPRDPAETERIVSTWGNQGRAALPASMKARPLRSDHQLIMMVYEFEKTEGGATRQIANSPLSVYEHLKGASVVIKEAR